MSSPIDIKAWREARALSQAQLAERLPVAIRTLQGWETGRATPPAYIARALADLGREMTRASGGTVALDEVTSAVHALPVPYYPPEVVKAATIARDDAEAQAGVMRELSYIPADD